MNRRKNITVITGLVIIAIVGWSLTIYVSHRGKARVTIVALPTDSTITVDGQVSKAGTTYMKLGDHTFAAARTGFTTAKKQVSVQKNENNSISLLPTPSSDEAIEYLQANPELQAQREAYGSVQDQTITSQLSSSTPIIKSLPYTDELGPFSLNYGFSASNNKGFHLTISQSSPEGRVAALKWMRSQGYDPVDYNIVFSDFINPFAASPNPGTDK